MTDTLLKLFLVLIVMALTMAVFKLAIILLIISGLIFRTEETVGFLLVLLIIGLISNFPMAALGVASLLALIGIYRAIKNPA